MKIDTIDDSLAKLYKKSQPLMHIIKKNFTVIQLYFGLCD